MLSVFEWSLLRLITQLYEKGRKAKTKAGKEAYRDAAKALETLMQKERAKK